MIDGDNSANTHGDVIQGRDTIKYKCSDALKNMAY